MILFYADAGWELDLTNTSITLIEENALFFNYFVKDYSLPSTSNIEQFTDEQLRFLNLENVSLAAARYSGQLLIDSIYKQAYLTIVSVKGKKIKHIIYYGDNTIPLLETSLRKLPFPIFSGSINSHANLVITKQYPEVGYNFPMIIDEEFSQKKNYEKFEGIINNYDKISQQFVTNHTQLIDGDTVIFNKNVLTPFPYIMHILKLGFDTANLTMIGDFVNDAVNNHLIWDTNSFLERWSIISEDSHIFSNPTSEYIDGDNIVSEYKKIFSSNLKATYKLKVYFKLPTDIEIISFKVLHQNKEIYSNATYHINEEIEINVSDDTMIGSVTVILKTRPHVHDLFIYNKFNFETTGDKLNIFPSTFSIADVLPDITFGKFLNMVRSFFKLKIVVTNNTIRLDYIDSVLYETQFSDKSAFEIKEPLKQPASIKMYKFMYNKNDFLYVDYKGRAYNPENYSKNEIEEINLNVKMLPIREFNTIFTAQRLAGDPVFKLLLYNGKQTVDTLPLAVESVLGRNFKIEEVFDLRYKKFILFLLNAITFSETFDCNVGEVFNIEQGQYKYNQNHIFKVIRRKRKNETTWTYTVESLTLD